MKRRDFLKMTAAGLSFPFAAALALEKEAQAPGLTVYEYGQNGEPDSLESFQALIEKESADKLAWVEYYTDWCPACRIMNEQVIPEVMDRLKAPVFLLKISLASETYQKFWPGMQKGLGVNRYPTNEFYAQGEQVVRFEGVPETQSLIDFLENASVQIFNAKPASGPAKTGMAP